MSTSTQVSSKMQQYLGIYKLQTSELGSAKCHKSTLFTIASALYFLSRRNRLDDFNEVHKSYSDNFLGSRCLRSISAAELLVGLDGQQQLCQVDTKLDQVQDKRNRRAGSIRL